MSRRHLIAIFIIAAAVVVVMAGLLLFSNSYTEGVTQTQSANPFGPGEGPPKIIMTYDNQERDGQLMGYTYSNQETISELPELNLANITSVSSDKSSARIDNETAISFELRGNPAPEARFDSLAVTAYTKEGTPVTVLGAASGNATYSIERLDRGEYVLIATATWIPEENSEEISGYVVYGFRIDVV